LTPHEYGPLIVINDEAGDFFAPQDASNARRAIKLLLSGNGEASEELTKTMTPADQETMQNIYHKQWQTFGPAILSEIEKRSEQLAAASPAGRLRFVHVPVLLLHGSDDNVIPHTEELWLKREILQDELRDALITPAIAHVQVGHKLTLRERLALVHWIALMIREAQASGESRRPPGAPAGLWLAGAAQVH
jgi:pimeloyl-ACP methyl ester carboxylesterase